MSGRVPFKLKLTGDTADAHQFQGYDGYMALAGFAWVLSLSSNYVETGVIRQRGEFPGRDAVRAYAPESGSVVVEFIVELQSNPEQIFALAGAGLSSTALLYAVVKRVLARNLGEASPEADAVLAPLLIRREGDLAALAAISESPIRQAHSVIGRGADEIQISGGFNVLNRFNRETKAYVQSDIIDDEVRVKNFSVASFNANSGYGSVFDLDLGHIVPFSIPRDRVKRLGPAFSWGLDQYTHGNGMLITMSYTSILAMDRRPKRYIVQSARPKR